jgi:hypothetical protein
MRSRHPRRPPSARSRHSAGARRVTYSGGHHCRCDQIPIPLAPPLALQAQTLTSEQIDAIRAYTDPATAGYELAKLITRLPDEMLALIAVTRSPRTGSSDAPCPS